MLLAAPPIQQVIGVHRRCAAVCSRGEDERRNQLLGRTGKVSSIGVLLAIIFYIHIYIYIYIYIYI